VNILNKQSRRADIWWSSLGEEPIAPHYKKKQPVTKCCTGSRNLTDSLERPGKRKMDMQLTQDRDLWRGVVNTVTNLLIP
jgi:hypothetical protein